MALHLLEWVSTGFKESPRLWLLYEPPDMPFSVTKEDTLLCWSVICL